MAKKYVTKKGKIYWPTSEMKKIALAGEKDYTAGKDSEKFWEGRAKESVDWIEPWKKVYEQKGNHFQWFVRGKLNVCYNAVDRHLKELGDKPAVIFVPEPGKEKQQVITYNDLHGMVNGAAEMLVEKGVKKGDVVAIYMPLIPEAVAFMLACARIGAIHSVVFSAFSSEALRTRIEDGGAKVLVTADYYYRKGKKIDLLPQAKEAVKGISIETIVMKRAKAGENLAKSKDVEPVAMDAEDVLFILYTSGTTGKPKGVMHSTGGYAVQAETSCEFVFNLQPEEVMWCTADIGWITGHTYLVYGPLLNGATTVLFEGLLTYPAIDRFLKVVEENKVNVFYTAPTALRMFASQGNDFTKKYKLNSLKILGTVGEPIDEETWEWYFDNIGKGRCPIVDTWWQTETGAGLISALPGVGPFVPTVAGRSFPGVNHIIIDDKGKKLGKGKKGLLAQVAPFAPGMLRGVWKNEERYKKYFKKGMYIPEDNAYETANGFRILGRSDDIIKVAGHRMSTAELENVLASHPALAEAAVVSKPDKIKGEVPIAFVKPKGKKTVEEKELVSAVVKGIGPIAKPSMIYYVEDLPKTRSGKIMRRILKALLVDEEPKGLTTLVNPGAVEGIKKIIKTSVSK